MSPLFARQLHCSNHPPQLPVRFRDSNLVLELGRRCNLSSVLHGHWRMMNYIHETTVKNPKPNKPLTSSKLTTIKKASELHLHHDKRWNIGSSSIVQFTRKDSRLCEEKKSQVHGAYPKKFESASAGVIILFLNCIKQIFSHGFSHLQLLLLILFPLDL